MTTNKIQAEIIEEFKHEKITTNEIRDMMEREVYMGEEEWFNINYVRDMLNKVEEKVLKSCKEELDSLNTNRRLK